MLFVYLCRAYLGTSLRWEADFDNTGCYFSIGPLLQVSKFEKTYQYYSSFNEDPISAVRLMNKYAYRPFSDDINENLIIPNNYYFMRNLIWEMEKQGRKDFAVITGYLYNHESTEGENLDNFKLLLFSNSIDLAGAANCLHGVTLALLNDYHNATSWFSQEIQGLYRDTIETIAYLTTTNFTNRIDVCFVGYAEPIQGLFTITRVMQVLTSADELPFSVMEESRDKIANAMRSNGTDLILEHSSTDWDGLVYFDGFLGNNDVDLHGIFE